MNDSNTTIAAISTPHGIGAIGIVRISGPDAASIADKVFQSQAGSVSDFSPNRMVVGDIISDRIKEHCMLAYFKAPRSYTGEDMVELYCHGGIKLMDSVLKLVINAGARPALNGEFTKRAFLNGKLALSDAEGVIDMINAESEAAINAGYRLMSGRLSSEIRRLTDRLQNAVSGLEAALDYPEELEEDTRAEAAIIIEEALKDLYGLYETAESGKMIKYGINAAIIGPPNAGKSSLLNAILKEDRVIVSEIAGTTRDTVSESVEIKGNRINFIDTAGIRKSGDYIEKQGVERAYKAISGADIVIKVVDATTNEIIESDPNKTTITVYNKTDISKAPKGAFAISAKTGKGIDRLLEKILELKTSGKSEGGEIITNIRHVDAIKRAIDSLIRAKAEFSCAPTDCLTLDIKAAYMALGEIDGSTASEKIIDEIFSRFCVGK